MQTSIEISQSLNTTESLSNKPLPTSIMTDIFNIIQEITFAS